MAYEANQLSAIGYGNGFTLWHYRTNDSAADIDNVGYFSAASRTLHQGDFIFVNAGLDSVPMHGVVVVTSIVDGVVDVTNLAAFGAVNTD